MKAPDAAKKKHTDLDPLLSIKDERQSLRDNSDAIAENGIKSDGEWVDRLLRLGGESITVSYPLKQAEDESLPLTSFSITGMPLKLDDSTAVHSLDASDTQVFPLKGTAEAKPGLSMSTIGGTLILSPKNLKGVGTQFGKLQGMTIMGQWNSAGDDALQKNTEIGPSDEAMIQAYAEDIELAPMPGLKLALKNGKVEKSFGSEDSSMHFSDSTLMQGGSILAGNLELKTAPEGLKTESGEGAPIDKTQFHPEQLIKGKRYLPSMLEMVSMDITQRGIAFKLKKKDAPGSARQQQTVTIYDGGDTEPVTDDKEQDASEKKQDDGKGEEWSADVSMSMGVPVQFTGVSYTDGRITAAARARLSIKGYDLELADVTLPDDAHIKAASATDGSALTLRNFTYHVQGEITAERGAADDHGLHTELNAVTLDDDHKLRAVTAAAVVDGFLTTFSDYRTDLSGNTFYSGAKVSTVLDFGKKDTDSVGAQKFHDFQLEDGGLNGSGFTEGQQSSDHVSQNKATVSGKKAKPGKADHLQAYEPEQEIFTKDGFIEVCNARMSLSKTADKTAVTGRGDFKFRKIPYNITTAGGREIFGISPEQDDPAENIDFTIDSKGDINAELDDAVELKLSDKTGAGIEYKAVLGNVSVEGGRLTAKTVTLYRGLAAEGNVDDVETDWLKKLLGGKIYGSLADISKTAPSFSDDKGMVVFESERGGKLGIEDFLGFISGEVDYAAGKVSGSVSKGAESSGELSFLSFGKTLQPGVSIPIAPFLNFEFGIAPSLSIGGSLGGEMDWGKPFSQHEKGDDVAVKANGEFEGKAGIGVSAGISAGVAFASVGVSLGGAIEGSVDGKAEGSTSLAVKKDENDKSHLTQTKNLELAAELTAKITATLSFSGEVKLLFWKGELFSIELAKKDLADISLATKLTKDKDASGIGSWSVDKASFSATALSKSVKAELEGSLNKNKGKKPNETPEKSLAERVSAAQGEAQLAWQALQQLKENKETSRKDVAVLVTPNEKQALADDADKLSKEVKRKVQAYLDLLNEQEKSYETEQGKLLAENKRLLAEKKKLSARQTGIHTLFDQSREVGMNFDNYKQEDEPQAPSEELRSYWTQVQRDKVDTKEHIHKTRYKDMDDKQFHAHSKEHKLGFDAVNPAEYDKEAEKSRKAAKKDYVAKKKQVSSANTEKSKLEAVDMAIAYCLFIGTDSFKTLAVEKSGYSGRMNKQRQEEIAQDKGTVGDFKIRAYLGAQLLENGRKASDFGVYKPLIAANPEITVGDFLKCLLSGKDEKGVSLLDKSGAALKTAPTAAEKSHAMSATFRQFNGGRALGYNDTDNEDDLTDELNRSFGELFGASYKSIVEKGTPEIDQSMEKISADMELNVAMLKQSELDMASIKSSIGALGQEKVKYDEIMESLKQDAGDVFVSDESMNAEMASAAVQKRAIGANVDREIKAAHAGDANIIAAVDSGGKSSAPKKPVSAEKAPAPLKVKKKAPVSSKKSSKGNTK